MDSRRGLQKIDMETMELFAKHNICFQVVLTKIDELKPTEVEKLRQCIHFNIYYLRKYFIDVNYLCTIKQQTNQ